MTSVFDVEPLAAWLTEHLPNFEPPFSIDKFTAGRSNPTYLLNAASGRYVLRRKPTGNLLPSAHAIDREFRLLNAIWPTGFPVPRPHALCQDQAVMGSDFYIMEFVDGANYRDGALPNVEKKMRATIYASMVDTLAALHNVNIKSVALNDFGKTEGFFERQLKRWIGQYRRSETERIEDMERLIEWLPLYIPAQDRCAIVHGDYRIDNLLFDHDGHVRAVVDWELSTLGDPLADFAYFALQWILPADGMAAVGGSCFDVLGIPSLEEVTARYCNATSRTALPSLEWYFAFNFFRLAAIIQGIKKRAIEGNASADDSAAIGARVPFYAAKGWERATKAKCRILIQNETSL